MTATVIRGDARNLPMPDASVDLIVTSPPYWALRSYTDTPELCARCRELTGQGWEYPRVSDESRDLRQAWPDWDAHVKAEHKAAHYDGQIGAEATPAAYIDSLIDCTREWMRVLKPTGSIWVNLGDKYSGNETGGKLTAPGPGLHDPMGMQSQRRRTPGRTGLAPKSLIGLPWRYAIRCIDELGLILRAEVIWSKPNGLPESVTDRVRRSHETWFHLVKSPRYFSAVDAIREQYAPGTADRYRTGYTTSSSSAAGQTKNGVLRADAGGPSATNPLGKLPGSVWVDQRVSHGSDLIRSILGAVAAGAITPEEGERIWTGQSTSCATSTSPMKAAGNGPATESRLATERSRSSAPAARTTPTGSATACSSGRSLTGSPSIISAGTPDASDPITSRSSPCERTSDEPTQSAPSVDTATPLRAPTSTSPRPASSTRSAGPASSPGSDAGESVWQVATQPLKVPAHLGIDHFAAYPMELPRRIVLGWSPSGICTACGEGRRPVVERPGVFGRDNNDSGGVRSTIRGGEKVWAARMANPDRITGEACACPDTSAPTRPSVVVDPFGGTGTTALVAHAYGRHGISVDMSSDYCRLAAWRTTDPGQLAAALEVDKPAVQHVGQMDLLDALGLSEVVEPPRARGLKIPQRDRDCSECGYRSQYARAACDRCGASRGVAS